MHKYNMLLPCNILQMLIHQFHLKINFANRRRYGIVIVCVLHFYGFALSAVMKIAETAANDTEYNYQCFANCNSST